MLPGIASTIIRFNEEIKNWTLQSSYEEPKSQLMTKIQRTPLIKSAWITKECHYWKIGCFHLVKRHQVKKFQPNHSAIKDFFEKKKKHVSS